MIKLQVIGHLGKDATSNNVNGKNVINFSVAHSEKFKDAQGQQKDKTIWVDCSYWTDKTGILPYLKKGTMVYVEGQPDIRTWQSNTGQQGASLTLRVGQVQLLGGGQQQEQGQPVQSAQNTGAYSSPTSPTGNDTPPADIVDDLPF